MSKEKQLKPFRFPFLDVTVFAETEEEAREIALQGKAKKKPKIDLNGDGKFDTTDASLAGQALNKSKSIK